MIEFNYTRRQSDVDVSLKTSVDSDSIFNSLNQNNKPNSERKLLQRSITYTPQDFPSIKSNSQPKTLVTLPERFRWKIRRKSSASLTAIPNLNLLENIDEESSFNFSEEWDDKKSDINQALQWITQEIITLKRQDKILQKRFQDLHESLKELRGIHSCPSLNQSNSSITSGASYLSLQDNLMSKQTLAYPNDNLLAFRARMVAEFQKSKPNFNMQSKAVSLGNIQNVDMESKPLSYCEDTSSCSSGVLYVTNSSYSIEDPDVTKYSDLSSYSAEHSRSSSIADAEQPGNHTYSLHTSYKSNAGVKKNSKHSALSLCENNNNNIQKEEENITLKWKQKVENLMNDSSSDDEEEEIGEDNTLTRENVVDKTFTESLEDILSSVSTKEEREGYLGNEYDEEIEYMV